jgi:hypothetical protein
LDAVHFNADERRALEAIKLHLPELPAVEKPVSGRLAGQSMQSMHDERGGDTGAPGRSMECLRQV